MSCILSPVSPEFSSPSARRLTHAREISGPEPCCLQDYGTEAFFGMAGGSAGMAQQQRMCQQIRLARSVYWLGRGHEYGRGAKKSPIGTRSGKNLRRRIYGNIR
jgi:hypothetical protein